MFNSTVWFQWVPRFQNEVPKQVRRNNIYRYSQYSFIISLIVILIMHPLMDYLFGCNYVFRYYHRFRKNIITKKLWIHRLNIYHNTSLRLFVLWSLLVICCSMWNIQNDLIQLTKRLGRIAVAMWPSLLLLTLKPSILPKILYLDLLPLHKWISRVMILASLLHSILYIWFFILQGTFILKMSKGANLWGVVAILLFSIIGITSLKHFRRYNFKLFYFTHYILTWFSILSIYLHARPNVPYYTLMNVSILVSQMVYKFLHTTTTTPNFISISNSLTLVEFPLQNIVNKPIYPSSHIRINIVHDSIWKKILYWIIPLTHPFTVISLPNDPDTFKLLVRNGNFPLKQGYKYYVTGSFESNLKFLQIDTQTNAYNTSALVRNQILTLSSHNSTRSSLHYTVNAKKVLIVVGGSGISFGLPLLHILNNNGCNVRLIWVTRDYRDLNLLNFFNKNSMQGLEIFITGNVNNDQDIEIDYFEPDDIDNNENNENLSFLSRVNRIVPATSYAENYELNHSSLKMLNTAANTITGDEIDFTNTYNSTSDNQPNDSNINNRNNNNDKFNEIKRNLKDNIFRNPMVVEPPTASDTITENDITPINSNRSKIRIPSYIKVCYGRPELNNEHYEWCLQNECNPNGYSQHSDGNNTNIGINNYTNSENNNLIDGNTDLECPENQIKDESEILSQVWVLAAGPKGLVENTKRWADDYGLRFHCESYSP